MLSRGLTSLLDSHKNKASLAAGPAAAAATAAAAAAAAAGFHNVPFATPKHHATEGRNDLQKHAAPKNNIFAATANGGGAGALRCCCSYSFCSCYCIAAAAAGGDAGAGVC